MKSNTDRHRNDIYGEIGLAEEEGSPLIPAATVVLLRDVEASGTSSEGEQGVEVLMLRRNSKIAFGGMWVFPGGRIDDEDFPEDRDLEMAARNAAVREAAEEASLELERHEMHWFANWVPPASTPRRYATWFFAARVADGDPLDQLEVDGGEILEHAWLSPRRAIERHAAGEIDLAPPTWVTLYELSRGHTSSEVVGLLEARPPRLYRTRLAKRSDGMRVCLWTGDAGYETGDADVDGATHRLLLAPGGFVFEHSAERY